jgi:hypothetical protein
MDAFYYQSRSYGFDIFGGFLLNAFRTSFSRFKTFLEMPERGALRLHKEPMWIKKKASVETFSRRVLLGQPAFYLIGSVLGLPLFSLL